MKTLILNGSPRINGDTSSLIRKITEKNVDEYKIVDAYRCNISPCLDCRYCWKNKGCSINDEMQDVYKYIQECDNILIASPLYFSELTGKLLDVGSRLQIYFCARFFRKEEPIIKSKKGAVILVGGAARLVISDDLAAAPSKAESVGFEPLIGCFFVSRKKAANPRFS
ncbi:MAG: flavodoxin family protein [Butyrivibrio sp.]|nr:flavodoxin family protein [Acetatifactor muris]MCM1561216.1 flavodoxin family protein [Butyrivibrio sp.]